MRDHADLPPRPHSMPGQRGRPADTENPLGTPKALFALQAAAGNRAVAQLVRPTVARRDPSGRGPAPLGGPAVQRVAEWVNGTVNEVNNLAHCYLNDLAVGNTQSRLNGRSRELLAPRLSIVAHSGGGFAATVATVRPNFGTFEETVLKRGPWRLNTTKAAFHAKFPSVPGCECARDGATEFRAYGEPDDAAMWAANRRHEDHHVADLRAAFHDIIVPWDAKLTAAKDAGTRFHGATALAAETALWAAVGGTAAEILDAYESRVSADADAFHASPAGGPVVLATRDQPVGCRDNCEVSWAHFTNPG